MLTETLLSSVKAQNWSWHQDAACRGFAPDLFFPQIEEASSDAKAICDPCPVRVECLAFALASGQRYGVWGGTSERERAELVARRTRVRRSHEPETADASA